MKDYNLENRRFVIGGVATIIVVVYILRLFTLQLMSDDYKKNADSNAFLKKVEFPSRGAITDRNGKLLVYNQPAYDIMVVMNEESGRLDTTEFCQTLGITKEFFIKRMNDIKDRSKNLKSITESLEATTSFKDFVEVNKDKRQGKYIRLPERKELNQEVNELLVVEFYNR